tara:strand:+ start:657 stop:1274 length:618 start_codon:yes stop_codon:yes gene_type:complete
MSSILDLKINEPSLCIPRVFSNITDERVYEVIAQLELGELERIDMVERETREGVLYQRVFIHFKKWNPSADNVRERLVNGEEIKIVYDDPWFWKVSASRSKRPRGSNERKAPRIEFSSDSPVTPEKASVSVSPRRVRRPSKNTLGPKSYAAVAGTSASTSSFEDNLALNTGLSLEAADKLQQEVSAALAEKPVLKRGWGSEPLAD